VNPGGASGLLAGLDAVREAARLLRRPAVRPFVVVPVLVNVGVFVVGGYWIYTSLADSVSAVLPADYAWLRYLLLPLLLAALAMGGFLVFSLVANLLATPFNGLLCEAILRELQGVQGPAPAVSLFAELHRGLLGELGKNWYLLKLVLPAILLWFIPGLNVLGVLVWPIIGIWALGLEYLDGVLGNQGRPFPAALGYMRSHRGLMLGAGGPLFAMTSIPGLNLFAMPLGVATATVLYARHLKPQLDTPHAGLATPGHA
jgi:CysZ protein